MGQLFSVQPHWETLTPFNVLAVYAQPAVEAPRRSRFGAIHSHHVWCLRRDNILLKQAFADAQSANAAAFTLAAGLPSLKPVSSHPFVAVRTQDVVKAFSDQNRTVIGFQGERAFYVQYAHDYEAKALAARVKNNLRLGG